jgi:hypothetical protein
MSRTAFKFLRDMWRHLVAMSLALALMALSVHLLERAATKSALTSVGRSPATECEDADVGQAFDLQSLAD